LFDSSPRSYRKHFPVLVKAFAESIVLYFATGVEPNVQPQNITTAQTFVAYSDSVEVKKPDEDHVFDEIAATMRTISALSMTAPAMPTVPSMPRAMVC
jgi:hypothetical protein